MDKIKELIEEYGVNPTTMGVILLRYNHMVWRTPSMLNYYRIPPAPLEDLYDDLVLIEVEPGTTETDFIVKEIQSELDGTRNRPECIPTEIIFETQEEIEKWHEVLRWSLDHVYAWQGQPWQEQNLGLGNRIVAFDYKEDETSEPKRYIAATPHY